MERACGASSHLLLSVLGWFLVGAVKTAESFSLGAVGRSHLCSKQQIIVFRFRFTGCCRAKGKGEAGSPGQLVEFKWKVNCRKNWKINPEHAPV